MDVCTAQNATANLRVMNIAVNTTELNITACFGASSFVSKLIDKAMPFVDAIETCKAVGLVQVEAALPSWSRRWQIRDYLEKTNYNNLNYTFWLGRIRPFFHVRQWFPVKRRYRCVDTRGSYINSIQGNLEDGQCSVTRRNESVLGFKEEVAIENCLASHPFVCFKFLGKSEFHVYHGFHIQTGFEPFHGEISQEVNATVDICIETCSNRSNCSAFTFYNDTDLTGNCSYVERLTRYVNFVNYTIHQKDNATHYAKGNCTLEVLNTTDIPNVTVADRSLPDCGVDEIPAGYLPCGDTNVQQFCNITTNQLSGTELAKKVTERISNLTVDKKSTSKYTRRNISAPDERKSSKAFGSLGVILIICVILIFPVSDYFVPKKRGKKRRANQDISKQEEGISI
ncbi:hypothetical protein ACF0H5_022679 [Mactra antiquata]